MIHTRMLTADGAWQADVPVDQLRPHVENAKSVLWLDLDSPTVDEVGLIGTLLRWDDLTVEDIAKQGQRAKLEHFDGYAYLVMHALDYGGAPARLAVHEVDFVIGPNYVATIHSTDVPHITKSREIMHQLQATLGKGRDFLLYVLTDELVDSYFPVLDAMHEAVDELEDQIVAEPSRSLMSRIFDMKRDGVLMRKTVSPQLEVFGRLTSPGYGLVGEEHAFYFRDVHDHLIRVFESADSYREMMGGALDAYLSNVSNRMNEVMKHLTVLAALFLPITFFTGLFGMNLREVPLWHDSLFWVFVVGMVAISVMQWLYFRSRGWA